MANELSGSGKAENEMHISRRQSPKGTQNARGKTDRKEIVT